MIFQGVFFYQGGFKEHFQQMKDLRSECLNNSLDLSSFPNNLLTPLFCFLGGQGDSLVAALVYAQVLLMVAAGALLIANLRFGGLLLALAMGLLVLTRDNPLLGHSHHAWKSNF
jgi:hypothetical protein